MGKLTSDSESASACAFALEKCNRRANRFVVYGTQSDFYFRLGEAEWVEKCFRFQSNSITASAGCQRVCV